MKAAPMNISKPTTLSYERGAAIYTGVHGTASYVCSVERAEATAKQFGMIEIQGAKSAYDRSPVRLWHA